MLFRLWLAVSFIIAASTASGALDRDGFKTQALRILDKINNASVAPSQKQTLEDLFRFASEIGMLTRHHETFYRCLSTLTMMESLLDRAPEATWDAVIPYVKYNWRIFRFNEIPMDYWAEESMLLIIEFVKMPHTDGMSQSTTTLEEIETEWNALGNRMSVEPIPKWEINNMRRKMLAYYVKNYKPLDPLQLILPWKIAENYAHFSRNRYQKKVYHSIVHQRSASPEAACNAIFN